MQQKEASGNVIKFARKTALIENASNNINKRNNRSPVRIIAITSGKGGVGKTNIVANLGYALSLMGKKVLILDADFGLGNIDVLLGMAPKYNLSHVIMGDKRIHEIIVNGPGDMKILPASSGIHELTELTNEQRNWILTELGMLLDTFDILFIDTAAGISSNVMYFNASAHEIIVVVSPEPTSITDAYALMKVLSLKYNRKHFRLIVNLPSSMEEAEDVYKQLHLVAKRFLDITIEYTGYVLPDENVTKSVRRQKIVTDMFPDTTASECFVSLAKQICKSPPPDLLEGKFTSFWKHLFLNKKE